MKVGVSMVSCFIYGVHYFSPMMTLLTTPTDVFRARLYKTSVIIHSSDPAHNMSQPQTDGTFSILKTQAKLFIFLFRLKKKKWQLKSIFSQTHLDLRVLKSWHYFILLCVSVKNGFPGGSVVKNPPADVGDICSVPESGRSPEEANGNPLQYSCLDKNPMDRGAW